MVRRKNFTSTTTQLSFLLLLVIWQCCSNFGSRNNQHLLSFVSAQSEDYFCGASWTHASTTCPVACPSGEDSVCVDSLGPGNSCFYFTGCFEKIQSGEIEYDDGSTEPPTPTPPIGSLCGRTWIDVMLTCPKEKGCDDDSDCADPDETCHADTNCEKPLVEIESEMIVTLVGASKEMNDDVSTVFNEVMFEFLTAGSSDNNIALKELSLIEQTLLDGKLDVSIALKGDYRPPPDQDLNAVIETYILTMRGKIVSDLRSAGPEAGTYYFDKVNNVKAVSRANATDKPTASPTKAAPEPTEKPTTPPVIAVIAKTAMPSFMPSPGQTSSTDQPTRAHNQVISSGARKDIQQGADTIKSYGYVFNIRTTPDSGVVLIKGLDFYTESSGSVNFELWTRAENYKEHMGTYDGWDKIASGSVQGGGIGKYTSIPSDSYTPVSINGGGSTRAFYLSLQTMDLVCRFGNEDIAADEPHASTPDLELLQGDGVLFYPFPDPDLDYLYRPQSQFLGNIYYDRLPCKPFSIFGKVNELPCDDSPTKQPTETTPVIESPTAAPVTTSTTNEPTSAQTMSLSPTVSPSPTLHPTTSKVPTLAPITEQPSAAPFAPVSANIIATIRNVPDREMTDEEIDLLVSMTMVFLRRHTEDAMTIDSIDFWEQKSTLTSGSRALGDDKKNVPTNDATKALRGTPEKRKMQASVSQVNAVEITLILRISSTLLPTSSLGEVASAAMEENQEELLDLLRKQQSSTYFQNVDGIQSRSVKKVTKDAPSEISSPNTPETADQIVAEPIDDSGGGVHFGVFIGAGMGALIFAGAAFFFVKKERSRRKKGKDMELIMHEDPASLSGAESEGNETDLDKLEKSSNSSSSKSSNSASSKSSNSAASEEQDELNGNRNMDQQSHSLTSPLDDSISAEVVAVTPLTVDQEWLDNNSSPGMKIDDSGSDSDSSMSSSGSEGSPQTKDIPTAKDEFSNSTDGAVLRKVSSHHEFGTLGKSHTQSQGDKMIPSHSAHPTYLGATSDLKSSFTKEIQDAKKSTARATSVLTKSMTKEAGTKQSTATARRANRKMSQSETIPKNNGIAVGVLVNSFTNEQGDKLRQPGTNGKADDTAKVKDKKKKFSQSVVIPKADMSSLLDSSFTEELASDIPSYKPKAKKEMSGEQGDKLRRPGTNGKADDTAKVKDKKKKFSQSVVIPKADMSSLLDSSFTEELASDIPSYKPKGRKAMEKEEAAVKKSKTKAKRSDLQNSSFTEEPIDELRASKTKNSKNKAGKQTREKRGSRHGSFVDDPFDDSQRSGTSRLDIDDSRRSSRLAIDDSRRSGIMGLDEPYTSEKRGLDESNILTKAGIRHSEGKRNRRDKTDDRSPLKTSMTKTRRSDRKSLSQSDNAIRSSSKTNQLDSSFTEERGEYHRSKTKKNREVRGETNALKSSMTKSSRNERSRLSQSMTASSANDRPGMSRQGSRTNILSNSFTEDDEDELRRLTRRKDQSALKSSMTKSSRIERSRLSQSMTLSKTDDLRRSRKYSR